MKRVFILLCVLTGCHNMLVSAAERAAERRTIVDAYLIAHGMARGYADETDANRTVVAQLMKLDSKAAQAVRDMLNEPDGNTGTAREQVAALASAAGGSPMP
jgi:hypothetical protein